MEIANTINASQTLTQTWQQINWRQARNNVEKIQARIVKAVQENRWRTVRSLQHLLANSLSAKQLAVKQVTENKGKSTPGVDGVLWSNPKAK